MRIEKTQLRGVLAGQLSRRNDGSSTLSPRNREPVRSQAGTSMAWRRVCTSLLTLTLTLPLNPLGACLMASVFVAAVALVKHPGTDIAALREAPGSRKEGA
eukprot:TRINITY_DN602_c0_g1_i4.p1 TRINITY_DN602_c0_g1~~TRINITY_DN602_c0_g1_i4.p1  ORF type:complete len:101 (-),score=3.46 TRINITY_DN602_c0_g1_i4:462-764(-)